MDHVLKIILFKRQGMFHECLRYYKRLTITSLSNAPYTQAAGKSRRNLIRLCISSPSHPRTQVCGVAAFSSSLGNN